MGQGDIFSSPDCFSPVLLDEEDEIDLLQSELYNNSSFVLTSPGLDYQDVDEDEELDTLKAILVPDEVPDGANEREIRVFNLLRSDKTAPFRRSKLMVVGEGRAGKTSTVRALLGEKFNFQEASTVGFNKMEVSRTNAKNWAKDRQRFLVEHLESVMHQKEGIKKQSLSSRFETLLESSNSTRMPARKESEKQKGQPKYIPLEEVKKYAQELNFSSNGKNSNELSFVIWDFGGQEVFYSLHHLFLTEFGCYLVVFNAMSLLDEKSRTRSLGFLKFWMNSKKLHAPSAPLILVGTHASVLSDGEVDEINELIEDRVLEGGSFNPVANEHLCFFPVENSTNTGIEKLRSTIEKTTLEQAYIEERVPLSYLRLLEVVGNSDDADYLSLSKMVNFGKRCGLDKNSLVEALKFLDERGLVTFIDANPVLREVVILHPQWVVNALTTILFDPEIHEPPKYGRKFTAQFKKFLKKKILSKGLLYHLWEQKGFDSTEIEFLRDLMLDSCLMSKFGENRFLIPSLFTRERKKKIEDVKNDHFKGNFFIIDFSGNFNDEMRVNTSQIYVKFLPTGFFERLVCLCVAESAKYTDDSVEPRVTARSAVLGFGLTVEFRLLLLGENDRIRVETVTGTSMEATRELVKKVFSMVESLRSDFFSRRVSESQLAISLLLPSTEKSGQLLADYEKLLRKKQNGAKEFKPRSDVLGKYKMSFFEHWFEDEKKEEIQSQSLIDPNKRFRKMFANDRSLRQVRSRIDRPLPVGLKYHCFLSYKQKESIDLVGKQYFLLTSKGFKCWYDMQFAGEINLESMREGVRNSMVYMLFLSKDVFPSPYIEAELAEAVKMKKEIILFQHPNTGMQGYWRFSDYINKAPKALAHVFQDNEAIKLERRFYLEEAVTKHVIKLLEGVLRANGC